MPPKGRSTKKQGGQRKGYTNPAVLGFESKTKQKTLRESLRETTIYVPLQSSPEQEIELLKILFPRTYTVFKNQNSRNKFIRKYIPEETYKGHIAVLHDEDMEYKNKYPAVQDLIKCFFKDNSTDPSITKPPVVEDQERYMWKKEISDELSQKIKDLVPKATNEVDETSATTLGRGSPYSETTASDYSPVCSPSKDGSQAIKQRVSLPRKGKASIPSEPARREEKTSKYTTKSLKVKTAIRTAVNKNSMHQIEKRTPSLSPSLSNASTNQAPPSQPNRVMGMINRMLSPKNQE